MKRTPLLFALLFCVFLAGAQHALAVSTVVIDAGHGGFDRGGMPGQRVPEKGFTLSVAKRVGAKLRAAGFNVVYTRSDDTFVGLSQRCAIANAQRSAVFLSIHFNAAPRTTASGVETYYYSGKSSAFAAAAHQQLLRVMGTPDRHVRQRGFFVIRRTNCPAILVEPAFLTNPDEVRRLNSGSFQDDLAGALARAVISRYR